jgi:Tfp pilus assembly protein PilW
MKLIRSSGLRRISGFTLAEFTVAMGVAAMLTAVVSSFSIYSFQNVLAIGNYVELDNLNRLAIDTLTADLRKCNRVISSSATSLVLEDSAGNVTYAYNSTKKQLSRTQAGSLRVLLTACENFQLSLGQRNPIGGTYDVYPAATPATAKVVNVSWICTRDIMARR